MTFASAALLAGCGGGGGDGGGAGGDGSNVGDNAAYSAAYDICVAGLASTASDYAIEPTRESVIELVVEQVSAGTAQDEEAARQGCTDGLDKAPRKDE